MMCHRWLPLKRTAGCAGSSREHLGLLLEQSVYQPPQTAAVLSRHRWVAAPEDFDDQCRQALAIEGTPQGDLHGHMSSP